MPWETDGRRWHMVDRVTTKGAPCRWEGNILTWLDERIHALADFGETNWNHRTQVEIAAPTKSHGWFWHGSTGYEWLLGLAFHVGKNTFKEADLIRRLGIKPLNETPGLEVYGNEERIRIYNMKGPWQVVLIYVHRLSEIDTPAFHEFLKQAVASFQQNLQRLRTKPEDLMPWKLHGERWHLGEKGFPPGEKVRWERSLLPRLLELTKEVVPGVQIGWNSRNSISLRVPGISRSWGHWRTKESDALDCRFLGKRGQFNLSQVEALGERSTIHGNRVDGDVVRLRFRHVEHLQPEKLKAFLHEQLNGFRELFANGAAMDEEDEGAA
jgi:excinuclease ABC subunit A